MTNITPELLLKCAKVAGHIINRQDKDSPYYIAETRQGNIASGYSLITSYTEEYNPLTNDAQAWELEDILLKKSSGILVKKVADGFLVYGVVDSYKYLAKGSTRNEAIINAICEVFPD